MNDKHIKTIPQVQAFLGGTRVVEFSLHSKAERCDFSRRTLIRFAYHRLSRADKSLLLNFMTHVSGYSRIQVKRLATSWLKRGQLHPRSSAGNGFSRQYADSDCRLLAELDELYSTLSGPAIKKLCERAWRLFKLPAYQLRQRSQYRACITSGDPASISGIVASSTKPDPKPLPLVINASPNPMGNPAIFG